MAMDGAGAGGFVPEFDFERLAAISDGDGEFEREIAREYLAQAHLLLGSIAEGVAAGDTEGLKRAAHTLKGSSRTIGAEGLGAVAAELERAAGGGEPTALVDLFNQLRTELAVTERRLDGYFGSDGYRKAA